MFFLPPETLYSKYKVAMVYDKVDRSGAIVGIEHLDRWTMASEERRDRTLRRQVVKRRERLMEIMAKAITEMDEACQEPGEVSDVLFFCALRLHLRDATEEADPEATEQEVDTGN